MEDSSRFNIILGFDNYNNEFHSHQFLDPSNEQTTIKFDETSDITKFCFICTNYLLNQVLAIILHVYLLQFLLILTIMLIQGIYFDHYSKNDSYYTETSIEKRCTAAHSHLCLLDVWVDSSLVPMVILPFTPSLIYHVHLTSSNLIEDLWCFFCHT